MLVEPTMQRIWSIVFSAILFALFATTGTATAQPVTNAPLTELPNERPAIRLPHAPGPRFVVKALDMQALDETGWDRAGSDEVVTVYGTNNYTLISSENPVVDSDGTVWDYDQFENCIYPAVDDGNYNNEWGCNGAGGPGPLRFTVGLYEQDANISLGFCANQTRPSGDLFPANADPCETDSPNDLIGKNAFSHSLEQLLQLLPRENMSFRARATIGYECDKTKGGTCGASDPAYRFRYRVFRVRDGD